MKISEVVMVERICNKKIDIRIFIALAAFVLLFAGCRKEGVEVTSGPDVDGGWAELPAFEETASLRYLDHYITINSQQTRNFSILYDTENHYPVWVAYPMHSSYLGNSGRGNNWDWDPSLAQALQPNLGTQYSGAGYGHDRGHMLPSASRTVSEEANDQTFYYTNICPQIGSGFNQNIWVSVENLVRAQRGNGQDTLYVVTGAVLQTPGNNEEVRYVYSRHDTGKKIAVPNYFYKALLKSSLYNGKRYYNAICLWYEHKNYGTDRMVLSDDCRTIRWLEEQTGIDFFTHLRQDIQDEVETDFTASTWGIRQ